MKKFFRKVIFKLKEKFYILTHQNEKLMSLRINIWREKGVKIGENMRSFSPLISAEPYLLEFGDDITISTEVSFITHDNSVIKVFDDATDTFGKIIIGNKCFIGHKAVILPGIELGENTIVAAGSIVTKSYKEGNIVIGGNPAKIITTVEEYKKKVRENRLNTKGMTYEQKKSYLIDNEMKFLNK